jgi:hypothetical protein
MMQLQDSINNISDVLKDSLGKSTRGDRMSKAGYPVEPLKAHPLLLHQKQRLLINKEIQARRECPRLFKEGIRLAESTA